MGKGSGASGARGGAAGGSGSRARAEVQEKEFSAKDLKTGTDRIGESKAYNSQVYEYSQGVVNSLNPGDTVKIEKTFKDGTTQSATLTVQQPTERTWNGTNATTTEIDAVKSGSLPLNYYSSQGYFSSGRAASNLATSITEQRSKVRSVRVTVTRR